jgi:DNA repair protein RadD
MQLRKYQRDAIDDVYRWASENQGHPCLEMPTGSGKSHIIAQLCIDAVQASPECRILMLTHVKELIEQNAEKDIAALAECAAWYLFGGNAAA